MGFNIDVLETDIEIAYRFLKRWLYPDPSFLSKCLSESTKNNFKAVEFRYQGNSEYELGQDHKALELYTKSIALAKEDSDELALAYGNRSAVLYRFGKYEQCLSDIKRALVGDHPRDRRKKLRDRKKKCLAKIKSEKTGDETGLSRNDYPVGCNFKNALLPNMSSKVKLSYSEKWGRHLVATENIEPGEIMSRQKFFSTFLDLGRQYTNCSYCFARCEALIPCRSCSQMMYCSEECRTEAFCAYHRVECKMWPFYKTEIPNDKDYGYTLVAMRTLYIGAKQGAQLEALVEGLDIRRDIFAEEVDILNKPFKRGYLSTLRTLRKFEEKPPKESILLAVKAVIMLQRLSFFENDTNPDLMSKTELFATLALLNHMGSIMYYNHAITETSQLGEVPIGLGVDPLHNLINHSCDPNVADATRFHDHLIFSLRPIERGQQIFLAYCTAFSNNPLAERKQKLALFGFTCHCEACTNNWPLKEALVKCPIKYLTTDEKTIMDILAMIMVVSSDVKKDKNLSKVQTLHNVVQFRKLIHNTIQPPSVFIVFAEMLIMNYMNRKYGNCIHFYLEDSAQQDTADFDHLLNIIKNFPKN